jgi:hypothetical protein
MNMKTIFANGILWTYRPGFVYTGSYYGWNINILHTPAKHPVTGKPGCWRLFVTKNGGGSLAFIHQFHETIAAARAFGKELVDTWRRTTPTSSLQRSPTTSQKVETSIDFRPVV